MCGLCRIMAELVNFSQVYNLARPLQGPTRRCDALNLHENISAEYYNVKLEDKSRRNDSAIAPPSIAACRHFTMPHLFFLILIVHRNTGTPVLF